MDKIKILIADDELDILEIMARKIAAAGFDVVTASDGQEAWEKIQQSSFDVLVLDLTMPRMTGFEVIQAFRKVSSKNKWVPVIIVSALGEMSDMQKGMELQADHYLVKPCGVEDVLKGIRLMLSLAPHRQESKDA